jgi:hypothetical protein
MLRRRTSDTTIAELQRELKELSDQGAGLAELLDELQRHQGNRRFGRRERLTKVQLDGLSRYCWSLQAAKLPAIDPSSGRPRGDLWHDSIVLRTTRLGSRSSRRAPRAG